MHRSLSRGVAQVLGDFCVSDIQTTHGPLWLLTNVLGENTTHWDSNVFEYYGAAYQAAGGEKSHPLTRAEAQFIQSDDLALPTYAVDLFLGYSAWWQNQKWLCPALEFCSTPTRPADQHHGHAFNKVDFFSHPARLQAFVESEAERLAERLDDLSGKVLLDLTTFSDRFLLHLCVPAAVVQARFSSAHVWQDFLRSLCVMTADPRLVYLDTNCEQERGGPKALANAAGKSYGCALYDLTHAPDFLVDDPDTFRDWLHSQDCCLKVWAPSEEAARYNARLACEVRNFIPVDPFTRQYLPREIHSLEK